MESCVLTSLPSEILSLVLRQLDAAELIASQPVCRALQAAASDEQWHSRLSTQLHPILKAFFDGTPPRPRQGLSWSCHYFEVHATWLQLAQERTGRVLLKIGTRRPAPPAPQDWADWSAFLWGEEEKWRKGGTYGVYDVTDFLEHHPGSPDLLLEAAARADATHSFEMGAHSKSALQMLATFVVPGLEAVPYSPEIEELQQRPLRSRGLFEHDRHPPWASGQTCIALGLLFATPVCGRCDVVCGAVACSAVARDFLANVPALPLVFLACSLCATLWTWLREGKPFLQSLPWSFIDLSHELLRPPACAFSHAPVLSPRERVF